MITTSLLALSLMANPRPFPFSYTYSTVAPGHLEVEQYIDLVPIRVEEALPDGTRDAIISPRFQLQTELELGLTEKLELGFYLVFEQGGGDAPLVFRGVKQRLRYRLFEQGELPVDIALYGEVAQYSDELEFEQKILLSRRFGPVIVAANISFEQEWYFNEDELELIYNPTLGVSYELSPHISLGLESWVRFRFDTSGRPMRTYLGPVLMAQKGEYWASVGGYVRMDTLGDTLAVGENYGPFYLRILLGIGL